MRIIRLIDGVHMGLSHAGLSKIASSFGVKVEELNEGDLVMFLNRKADKLKILGKQGQVLGYLKPSKGQRISLDAIQFIPQTFGGGSFNYEAALEQALTKRLKRTFFKPMSPLQLFRAKKGAELLIARKQKQTQPLRRGLI